MRNAEYDDPRLVEVYDIQGLWGRDDEYFLALVNETPSARVLDLGCGTGRLAVRLAAAGHVVTGIDPSATSLSAARVKAGADGVVWMLGTARDAPQAAFDIAIMTGHVAQFLLTEDEWRDALGAVWRALVPGGRLAFHAYDPTGRVWERWNPTDSRREVLLSDGSHIQIRTEVTNQTADIVSYAHHYRFPDGTHLRSDSSLRFWSEQRWRDSVTGAGFAIERVHGGWLGQSIGAGDGELIFVARRSSQRPTMT